MIRIGKPPRGYFSSDACDLTDFAATVLHDVHPRDVPQAAEIVSNVPIYDMPALAELLEDFASRRRLLTEWAQILRLGAGVFVLRRAIIDIGTLDAATRIFETIIDREKAEKGTGADHFAAAGSNDRIWNALQKLCEADPEVFLRYHGNAAIDAACEAWLGPAYQMTAQVNVVRPGGQAQAAHRDYHLGFQSAGAAARFPVHVHDLSAVLTLQGAIAHGDMPLESGPTQLLPFSQLYRPGYVAFGRADFRAFFESHCVQVPLLKGDAVFFNPALFHAAGANSSTDVQRMANLLQVSSAFGRAMEAVDRVGMCKRVFSPLLRMVSTGALSGPGLEAAIAATAEGYPFPTSLDRDPPRDGLAPASQADLLRQALREGWPEPDFAAALDAQVVRRRA